MTVLPTGARLAPPTSRRTASREVSSRRNWGVIAANTAMWLAQGSAHRALLAAARDLAAVQRDKLFGLLRANADSAYGRAHGFASIRSVTDFQDRVPLVTYDDLVPWIERILQGEGGVLTTQRVLMLEKSSGTAAASKFIPYTASLRAEFGQATGAWLGDLYGRHLELRAGRSYWSVSPLREERARTAGGLPIGFEDDTEYFGWAERLLLGRVLAAPGMLTRVADVEAWRHLTLYFLLACEDLRLISVWNTSFLTVLLSALPALSEGLAADLERGTLNPPGEVARPLLEGLRRRARRLPKRAAALREAVSGSGGLEAHALWPDLFLLSCWTEAAAEHFLPGLRALFPGVLVQGKGLLSTEGAVSVPLVGLEAPVLAANAHFYEFLDLDRPDARPVLAHQLDRSGCYRVVLSTGGGFYRYLTGDAVEVVGHWEGLPMLRFVGKADLVSDLCGEKLSALFVERVMADARRQLGLEGPFAMVAPELGDPPCYQLLASVDETQAQRLAALLEEGFQANPHYAHARRIGQIGPLVGHAVPHDAPERYLAACRELGQRVGDVKPVCLQRTFGWRERLGAPTLRDRAERVERHGR